MAYRCQYRNDVGCPCHKWTPEDADYCSEHKAMMLHIDALEKEINDTIHKAREK